jgi:hypothetical protein
MVKAEKPKAKSRSKPKFTDKAQSERFIETARKLEIEDTAEFGEMVAKIVSVKIPHGKK